MMDAATSTPCAPGRPGRPRAGTQPAQPSLAPATPPDRPRRPAIAPAASAPTRSRRSSPRATRSPASPTSTAAARQVERLGYDCSGSVSYALHGAGLLDRWPRATRELGRRGPRPVGDHLPKASHAYMVVAGIRFDTSGRTERQHPLAGRHAPRGYVARHPTGLEAARTCGSCRSIGRWPHAPQRSPSSTTTTAVLSLEHRAPAGLGSRRACGRWPSSPPRASACWPTSPEQRLASAHASMPPAGGPRAAPRADRRRPARRAPAGRARASRPAGPRATAPWPAALGSASSSATRRRRAPTSASLSAGPRARRRRPVALAAQRHPRGSTRARAGGAGRRADRAPPTGAAACNGWRR